MNGRLADNLFLKEYYIAFIFVLALIFILSWFQYTKNRIYIYNFYSFVGFFLTIATALYLGLRSDDVGIDTVNYRDYFSDIAIGGEVIGRGDVLFYLFMWIFTIFFSWNLFLIFCGIVYVGAAFWGFKRIFGPLAIYALLLFIISPNFFQFGMNLMRNGVAASLFILAVSFYGSNKRVFNFLLLCSVLCHISMLLPIGVFYLFRKTQNISRTIIIWSISLVIFLMGFNVISLLSSFLPEYVISRYISRVSADNSATLFNFILYGASPVFASIYFIYKRNYYDKIYIQLMNVYILLNAFYIQFLGIEDALRFAYLSEFMMPLLLFYPLLKKPIIKYQSVYLSTFLFCVFMIKAVKILTVSS